MDRRKGIVTLTNVELIQVVLKNVQKQEAKMSEDEVAAKPRNIQVTIYSASVILRRHFCGTCKRTENRNKL